MSKRTYGQYCGFARALELVGERWALMIVRDLLVEPKRFSDLQRGLPGIPTNILTARLKELEQSDIVRRRLLPRPSGAVVYELTETGRGLEAPVHALGAWGAKLLGDPRSHEIVTPDSLVTALRTTFQPAAA
ncbi:MAG TPA: helix-turn-helix domain-containing protein, partial [Candidatus Tumulicola sp.]|nr:helix-turn-helix domain-containing protein [Candidatus Tumulicola sp.]